MMNQPTWLEPQVTPVERNANGCLAAQVDEDRVPLSPPSLLPGPST